MKVQFQKDHLKPNQHPLFLTQVQTNIENSRPSPRPSTYVSILDSILEGSGGNHGGQSSSDRSLSGNKDGLTLQSVYDLCVSLCKQVTTQAAQIKDLKSQIKQLKKKAKPMISHHNVWIKSVSIKKRLARKKSLKKKWMQKESVSKQGRKSAKSTPTAHLDQVFDDVDVNDAIDYMETDAYMQKGVSTEDQVSTVKPDEGTSKPKVSIDKPEVSTAKPKEVEVSTDKLDEGTAEPKDGISNESTAPVTVFRDDETIAEFLVSMSQNKAKQKDKGKKVLEEEAESDAESDAESEGVDEAKRKFDQLAKDEEIAKKYIDLVDLETKSFVSRLHKVSSPDGDYLVVYRVNGHFRAFNYLMEGDLKIMMESSTEENDQEGTLAKNCERMLDLGLEVEEESTAALHLDIKKDIVQKAKRLLVKTSQICLWLTIYQKLYGSQLTLLHSEELASPGSNSSWLSIHLVVYNEELAIPEQTVWLKDINSLLAGSFAKNSKPAVVGCCYVAKKICC
ncbi:hypothetical protein Tco_1419765 [Tanacetum coccineum]